jgi:L-ribulose-5-phosphate 4-epimerase
MALETQRLDPESGGLPQHILDKHFLRKHGPGAYYGQ